MPFVVSTTIIMPFARDVHFHFSAYVTFRALEFQVESSLFPHITLDDSNNIETFKATYSLNVSRLFFFWASVPLWPTPVTRTSKHAAVWSVAAASDTGLESASGTAQELAEDLERDMDTWLAPRKEASRREPLVSIKAVVRTTYNITISVENLLPFKYMEWFMWNWDWYIASFRVFNTLNCST